MNKFTLEQYLVARVFQERMHSLGTPALDLAQIEFLLNAESHQQQLFLNSMLSTQIQKNWTEDLKRDQDFGIRHSIYRDDSYPRAFTRMDFPPLLFSYLGQAVWMERPGLAVVGSREISQQSIAWMETHLSDWMKSGGSFVASGGARGVDQKAHEICLRLQVPTVVVIPSGLGRIYPSSLASWVSAVVAQGGAIVSEYQYSQEMRKHFFQARNRLICGLGQCTLVVQSARRSGTQLTARITLEQGRAVLVVPSHPLDLHHRGGLDLIVEGAAPVRDAEDLKHLFRSEAGIFVPRFPPVVGKQGAHH